MVRRPSSYRTARRLLVALALSVASAASSPAAEGPSATPQRPSLSFSAATVPQGGVELEAGGFLSESTASLPVFLKYGLLGHVELELGFDAVRTVETPRHGTVSSQGDLVLGARWRFLEVSDGPAVATAGYVKAPTAKEEAGSDEWDAGLVAIGSFPLGNLGLDANLWLNALGRPGGGALGQVQAVATLGFPVRGSWSGFVEAAWQRTASSGSGGFLDAGLAWSASHGAVLDLSAGLGWDDGYPDWTVNAGWTILVSR